MTGSEGKEEDEPATVNNSESEANGGKTKTTPIEAEAAPVEAEAAPVEAEAAPVEAEAAPIEAKAAPIEAMAAPIEAKAAPIEAEAAAKKEAEAAAKKEAIAAKKKAESAREQAEVLAEEAAKQADKDVPVLEDDDITIGYDLADMCGFRGMDIKEFAESFKLSDILGDGIVTVADLPNILNRVGECPGEKEFQRLLCEIDSEGEGLFNFQQFVRLMTYFDRHIITEEEITEAFKMFDRDSSGSIGSNELLHVLQSMGDKMTEIEANGMIAEADKDGDGEISYGEFVKTILSTS